MEKRMGGKKSSNGFAIFLAVIFVVMVYVVIFLKIVLLR